jgi:rhomboid protease GluP
MQEPQQDSSFPQQPTQVMVRLPITRPLVTYVLLGTIIAVFVAQTISQQNYYPADPLTRAGALDFRAVLRGEYYRLFTSMFLHLGLAHIFFNGWALWSFGQSVERLFGHTRFVLIYFLGGLCGSIASLYFTRGLSVGASGAIFAIFGAEMIFLYHNRRVLGEAARQDLRSLIFLAVINFAIGLYSEVSPQGPAIDNWGHIGGFCAGIVLGWFIAPQYRVQPDPAGPTGFRIQDTSPIARTWPVPLLFAGGLVVALVYAVMNLGLRP